MKTIGFGLVVLMFAFMILTSPYWLFREIVRPDDEPLPAWMGAARARKTRLAFIVGGLALLGSAVVIATGLAKLAP